MSTQSNNSLLDWITIAKGFGIIFVVIGHFIPKGITPNYYIELKELIYTFHMPLFFLLAGFLFNYAKYSYIDLFFNKLKRLIYPFLSVAIFFFIVKYFAGLFFEMKHPMTIEHVFTILTDPRESYMSLLWFVYTLFLIFLIYPPIKKYLSNNFIILSIFVILNIFFAHSSIIYSSSIIGDVLEYIPFFIGGVILRENQRLKELLISGTPLVILVNFILFALLYWLMPVFKEVYYSKFILGIVGSFLFFNISYFISASTKIPLLKNILITIGVSSMTIYLFHNLFLGGVKVGFLQVLKGFPVEFEIIAIIAIVSAIIFPMILENKVFRKYAIFRKYLLGLK